MDHYFTIEKNGEAEFKDRGSRFLAYAFPLKDPEIFKKQLNHLKKEHPKAVHHCFAYRIGVTGEIFRANDDGEPAGTAGKPILGQIDSKQVTNTAVIVVRYFGGSLLGVPGLINAYKTVTSLVLQTIPIIKKHVEVPHILHFGFEDMNQVLQLCRLCQCTITEQELQLFPYIKVNIPVSRLEEVLFRLKEMRNVDFSVLV